MKCPGCQGETRVLETREAPGSNRRRRRCLACDANFTTYEAVVQTKRVHVGAQIFVVPAHVANEIHAAAVKLLEMLPPPAPKSKRARARPAPPAKVA